MNETTKHPGGRPTKYKDDYAAIVETMAKMGATIADIAEAFQVAESTIYLWANEHPEFSEGLLSGRSTKIEYVKKSLYHRAIGYSHRDIDIRAVAAGNNMGSEIVQTPIVKHYPPDVTAAKFILINQDGWSDRQTIDQTSSDGSMSPKDPGPVLDAATIRAISKALDDEC